MPLAALRSSSRRIAGIALLGTAALALASCSSTSGDAGGSDAEQVAVAAVSADPQSLNPGATTDFVSQDIAAKIFEGLIWLDAEGQPQPLLAESWEISEDGLTYTFNLEQDVTWSDGEPFTSEDVAFTLTEGLANNSRAMGVIEDIASVDTPDEHTVVVALKAASATFLSQMKFFDVPILPKHVYQGISADDPANNEPVGTGPFVFDSWERGTSVTLVQNEDYWDEEHQPQLDEIIFQIVPDAQTRTAGLQNGEYDYVASYYLPATDVAALEDNPDVVVQKSTAIPALDFMIMNHEHPALGNELVRQAIATAIDRDRIVEQGMSGVGIPGAGSFGAGFPWLEPADGGYEDRYAYDVDAAQALMDEAGVGELSLRLSYDSARPTFVQFAQIIKDDLSKIGITVELQPAESTVVKEQVYTERDFDLSLGSFTSSGDPAIGYHRLYVTNTETAPNINATGYSNPEVDALLAEAAQTIDLDARAALYAEAQVMLDDAVPTLILADEQQVDAASTSLKGMFQGVNPLDRWQDVSREG